MLKRIMQLCSFLVLTVPAVAVPQIERLDANGPDPKYADELMLFGQFVGDWKFDMIVTRPDGTKVKGDGEWHFGWVLGGRAVQDVWIARDDVSKFGAQFSEWGSTMRFYDPKLDSWHVVWSGPMRGSLMTFVSKKLATRS